MVEKIDNEKESPHNDFNEPATTKAFPVWAAAMMKDVAFDDKEHKATERRYWARQNWTQCITVFVSACALVAAAIAAYYQWSTSEEVKVRQLRAYILTNGVSLECPDCDSNGGIPLGAINGMFGIDSRKLDPNGFNLKISSENKLSFVLKNFGQTPAYDVSIHVNFQLLISSLIGLHIH